MHRHTAAASVQAPAGGRKIVLTGNPNTGKSVIFNYLSGLYVDVSNFPGTTVEVHQGRAGQDIVSDTPGIYGVSSFNVEEEVARNLILGADVVICVVDATHLSRDLFLTLQLIDLGLPMVVALNIMDGARRQGLNIDLNLLSRLLGVPVFPTVATQKKGLEELRRGLSMARVGPQHPELQARLATVNGRPLPRAEALLLLEGDLATAEARGLEPLGLRDQLYAWRRRRVNDIVSRVENRTGEGQLWQSRLGFWMMYPLTGIPLLAASLFVIYKLLGEFVAGDVVGFTEETLGQGLWEPWIRGLVHRVIAEGSVLETIITGKFGLLTMTVTYLFGVILPLVLGFYFLLSVLEDSGYLPRIAVLADGLLQRVGLNGRAVIPMILGLGCVTMATVSVRMLSSKRERVIATFLMALAIPCSAQLGVILGILAAIGGGWYSLAYVCTIFSVFVIAGTLLDRFAQGESTDLLLDIPPVRLPRLDNLLRKTLTKTYMFMKEVAVFFALGALFLAVLQVTGALEGVQEALAPLTEQWLRLPREAATAFVMGFVRRDFGAAGLYQGDELNIVLTPIQSLSALVALTLFVPCIASVLIILKERGSRYAAVTWIGTLATAFLVAGVVVRIGEVVVR
jgi:ferrous iron transport protein B